jgi:UDP-N-acetylglucosamine acyltransferase
MPKISPLASVDPKANLANDVEVGPFCLVGPDVTIGRGTRLISHVVVTGRTRIGEANTLHPHCVVGGPPQDLKYKGEPTGLEVGDRNVIREAVTIHTGTAYGAEVYGGGITRLGDDNLLMVNTHVGHDAQIGSRCVLANNVMIAGHIVIGDRVILNGGVGINAWVSIGDFAYIAGYARVHHDVPPFVKVSDDNEIRALNELGLRRAGYSDADIEALESAARQLFFAREKPLSVAMKAFDTLNGINPHVKAMIEFLRRRDTGKHGRYLEGLRVKK